MKIVIRELREGSNPIRFSISAATLAAIVKDLDDLYDARSDGEVEFDLQKYDGLMHLSGAVRADVSFECARCLADRVTELRIPIHWTLLPKEEQGGELSRKEEIELSTDDLDTSFYEGEEIDLGDLAREAILLELEPVPRCPEGVECDPGPYLSDEAGDTDPDPGDREDPRWAPLKDLLERNKSD